MYVVLVTTYSENWGKHVIWHDAWIEQSAHCVVSSVCVCVVGRGGGGGIMFLPVRGSSLTFESVDEILTSVIIQMKVYESIKSAVYYAVQGRFDLLIL